MACYERRKRTVRDALGGRLRDLDVVRGAAVHTPHGRGPWIELLVEATLIGPAVLREIADHNCGVAEVDRREG